MKTTEEIVASIRSWAIKRIRDKSVSYGDARSIVGEYYEWLNPSTEQVEVMSLGDV